MNVRTFCLQKQIVRILQYYFVIKREDNEGNLHTKSGLEPGFELGL